VKYLRPYQQMALEAFRGHLAAHPDINRVAIELATGLGKTVTASAGIADFANRMQKPIVVLTHTEEITGQWVKALAFATEGRHTVGVVKADQDDWGADIVVASVQTLANPARRARIPRPSLVVVDECHHAIAPTYRAVLEHLGSYSGVPTLGLTATLARSDKQSLGHVWQDLIFSRGISWAQRQGWLLDVVSWTIKVPDITATASDQALDAMLADSIAPEVVVEQWAAKAVGLCEECGGKPGMLPSYCPNGECGLQKPLPSTVVFAPLVKSAGMFADAFNKAGVKAEVIHGALPRADRANILDRYEQGVTTVLCNAMVLTEGWDSPRTMCVVWGRPTTSVPLFIQGVGRGLRPWLSADAPPREEQRCILLAITDTSSASLATIADLSEDPLADVVDGKSLQEMEDEFNLGRELDEEERAYRGPVHVVQWDPLVAASSKAWKYTKAGVPFLPTAKSGRGYVFVVGLDVYAYMQHPAHPGRYGARKMGSAPDVSLAMAVAEDLAQELGGDIGALLADKGRAWRKGMPSVPAIQAARAAGVPQVEVEQILRQRAGGKAGKLSDLIDTVVASRVVDPIAARVL
jgi:superfamily II DNA or RNA helicase